MNLILTGEKEAVMRTHCTLASALVGLLGTLMLAACSSSATGDPPAGKGDGGEDPGQGAVPTSARPPAIDGKLSFGTFRVMARRLVMYGCIARAVGIYSARDGPQQHAAGSRGTNAQGARAPCSHRAAPCREVHVQCVNKLVEPVDD